jgi:hypothetical protein
LFILKPKNYSEIEIYNLLLTVSPPAIPTLKNIVKILTANYRPIPTKIDKEFSKLAKNYSDYLEYYGVKRQWNNGYAKKHKSAKNTSYMSVTVRDALYKEFYNDLDRLAFEYRVISKIVIDIYRNKQENYYINKDSTYELSTFFVTPNTISIKINCLFENFNSHQLIALEKFERNNSFFKKNFSLYNALLSCVAENLN